MDFWLRHKEGKTSNDEYNQFYFSVDEDGFFIQQLKDMREEAWDDDYADMDDSHIHAENCSKWNPSDEDLAAIPDDSEVRVNIQTSWFVDDVGELFPEEEEFVDNDEIQLKIKEYVDSLEIPLTPDGKDTNYFSEIEFQDEVVLYIMEFRDCDYSDAVRIEAENAISSWDGGFFDPESGESICSEAESIWNLNLLNNL